MKRKGLGMRRFAVLALIALVFSSCKTLPEPKELEKEPVYTEADYFTLVRVDYTTRSGDRIVGELAGFLAKNENDGKLYVITAGHIQNDYLTIRNIRVWFKNNKERAYDANLLGYDHSCDAAVLGLPPDFRFTGNVASLGDSDTARVGDTVYSLGHPNGNHWYISKGRIRDTDQQENGLVCLLIEHSALGGPGSSGGPLLNTDKQVIGMSVAFIQRRPGQNTSDEILAIKINDIKARFDLLIAGYRN